MNLITRAELRDKLERHEEFKLVMTLSERAYEQGATVEGSASFRARIESV